MSLNYCEEAYVTLATTDAYAMSALVLGISLRKVGTTRDLVVMVTNNLSQQIICMLKSVFHEVQTVTILDSCDENNLKLLSRPDLGVTFTKLHCWLLIQYKKAVFMDADTLVLQNIDDLFERDEFSAAPDPGWPDCFNSGVFVFQPSKKTYNELLSLALTTGSYDGGDQGLLNQYFSDWSTCDIKKHLPFTYNCVSQAFYSYLPAWQKFKNQVRVVHFIGAVKPWHMNFNNSTGLVQPLTSEDHQTAFVQLWWDLFIKDGKKYLDTQMGDLAEQLTQVKLQPSAQDSGSNVLEGTRNLEERRHAWERGEMDYLGSDSFNNILAKINESLSNPNN